MISIIVPVYNVERYISKCLESLISQTYDDIEIICINDGSHDNSNKILEEYYEKDKRIKIINQVNQGVSAARNNGIKNASGEFILFVDADDFVDSNYCESLINQTDETTDCVISSYIREFNNRSTTKYIFGKDRIVFEEKKKDLLFAQIVGPYGRRLSEPDKMDSLSPVWGKLYKESIISNNNLMFKSLKDIGTNEDLLFNINYFLFVKKVLYIPQPFYHYRKNNITSITSVYKPNLFNQWINLFNQIKYIIGPLNRYELNVALNNRMAMSILGIGLNEIMSRDSHKTRYSNINNILKDKDYRNAINKLSIKYFPIHWKIFYGCVKHQLVLPLYLLLLIIKKII